MNKHWQLRDEWYQIFHNWPVLAAFFLLGGIIGWAAGFVWPPYSRASQEVYVALNPYRAYSDAQFLALAKPRYSNVDNYHYWQMNQLEPAIYRSDLLRNTLQELRVQDRYWDDINADTLRNMLDSEWRTAGAWRLSAFHSDEQRARQAVEAWSGQITMAVPQAVAAARDLIDRDESLAQAGRDLSTDRRRLATLQQAVDGLQDWQQEAAHLPADAPLPPELRWRFYMLATANAENTPPWLALLQSQPESGASTGAYLAWYEHVLAQLRAELTELPNQIASQEALVQNSRDLYDKAAAASLSLSPNLEVEKVGEVWVENMRPTATLAMVGAFLGMLAWVTAQIIAVSRRSASQVRPQENTIS